MIPKDLRKLLDRAAREGWVSVHTKGGHLCLIHTNGARVYAASTPSDHRALRNLEADMRRAVRHG